MEKEEKDPAVIEARRKQEYLKDSNYVEIVIDTENNALGEFTTTPDGKTVFAPNKEKRVSISEIFAKSND